MAETEKEADGLEALRREIDRLRREQTRLRAERDRYRAALRDIACTLATGTTPDEGRTSPAHHSLDLARAALKGKDA